MLVNCSECDGLVSADNMDLKNADEKEPTFSWRNRSVRKRTKADKKLKLCKSTLKTLI